MYGYTNFDYKEHEQENKNLVKSIVAFIILVIFAYLIVRFNINSDYKDNYSDQAQYIISFDTKTTSNPLESMVIIRNEKINLPSLERDDYTFVGWVDENNNIIQSPYIVTEDATLTASWLKNDFETYKVSFDLNGGYGTIETQKIKEGTTAIKPSTPKREGYTFIGWYYNNKEYDFNKSVSKDIILKAKWKVDSSYKFTVSFILNNGKGTIETQTVKSNGTVTKPKNPTRSGYTFKGWYLNGEKYDFDTKVTTHTTLVAYWEKNQSNSSYYKVSFDVNGGKNEITAQLVTKGKTATVPTKPTRSGYTFKGWYLNGNKYDFDTKVTSNITLVAKWSKNSSASTYFTVKFDVNTGDTKVASQKVISGGKVSKPEDPTKEGFVFLGWYYNGRLYDFDKPVTKSITLGAAWRSYSTTKYYTVYFNTNGGSGNFTKQTVVEGGVVSKPTTTPTKSGYTFKGWYLDGLPYDFSTPITYGFELIAMWENEKVTYNVWFNLNGGTGSISTQRILEGNKVTKPENPTRNGYKFSGWYIGNIEYNFNQAVMSDMTLSAKWTKNSSTTTYYVVTFDSNGGNSVYSQTIASGSKASKPSNPTRSGYTFKGWYYNGSEFNFNTSITSNITLEAYWTKNTTSTNTSGNSSTSTTNTSSCTATSSKSNVTSSGVQVHCLTQTCSNSKISLTNNTSTNSITCKSGYTKKYYLKNSTCSTSGASCSTSGTSYCKQEWYYSCEPIYTIINVPIDSRPVTRSNFEYVVRSVGFDYEEVSSGLDSTSNSSNSGYNKGNYATVISKTKSLVSSNNNKNSIVIINTTSYFFGGLTESRGYSAYENMNSKISSLTSLLSSYSNPKYYVSFIIPRTRPEGRAIDVYSTYENVNVPGLQCYYDMSKGKTQSNCTKVSFSVATMEWAYLKSLQKQNLSAWKNVPTYVKDFYNGFVNTYTGSLALYKEGGVSAPELYEKVFTSADSYLSKLFSLKSSGYIDEIVIGTDDFEIPGYLRTGSDTSWVPKDSYGNVIKYSFAYDLFNKYYAKKSSTVNFFGTDEINNLIFAREVVRTEGKKVKYNYSVLSSMNTIDPYDRMSASDSVKTYISFVNQYGSGYFSNPMEIKFIDSSNSSSSSLISSIQSRVNNGKNVFVLQVNSQSFSRNILEGLNSGSNSVFNVSAISGWNTLGNALGIGLSRSVAYTALENDLSIYDMSTEMKNRLTNYTKTQMISVLEDSIYNSNKTLSNLNSTGKSVINSELNNVKLSIGKYNYYVSGASFTASNPWNRSFEPYIVPTISSITVSTK